MSRQIIRYVLLLAVMLTGNTFCYASDGKVLLKSELNTPDKIWLGQQLDLNVTLYTTSTFSGVTRFAMPNDSGLVMIVDDAHPVLGSETIDGISYISKQYTISLFPLRAGTVDVPSFQVDFGYQGENGEQKSATLDTTAEKFTIQDIPGHDASMPLVTAEELKVDDRWNPDPGKGTVGDAFTRSVTMTATGLPGMALPPVKVAGLEGIAVYPGQPQVSTDTERGGYIGKRVQTFSYVCEKAGTYTLPEMKIQWWNPSGEELQVVKLSAVTLKVAPNPILKTSASESAAGDSSALPWLLAAGVLVVTTIFAVFVLRRKRSWFVSHNRKTERELYQQFKLDAESNDGVKTIQALIQWLDATGFPGGLADFMQTIGDPELSRQLIALETNVYSRQKMNWSGQTLLDRVKIARQRLHRQRRISSVPISELGPLNPY